MSCMSLSEIVKILNEIDDNIVHDKVNHVIISYVPEAISSRKLKAWSSSPRHQVDVVEHLEQYGYQSVRKEYEVELSKYLGNSR
jgi:hypothetical protein